MNALHCPRLEDEPSRPLRGEELLAWPVMGAVVLTALNDHVLKAFFPGFITGKISDFSGLFFFPFLLTALLGNIRHIGPAALVTGITFTILKLTGVTIGPVRILRDPTDLLALVSPGLAVLYARRRWQCAR